MHTEPIQSGNAPPRSGARLPARKRQKREEPSRLHGLDPNSILKTREVLMQRCSVGHEEKGLELCRRTPLARSAACFSLLLQERQLCVVDVVPEPPGITICC